jgi:hypothetical protein
MLLRAAYYFLVLDVSGSSLSGNLGSNDASSGGNDHKLARRRQPDHSLLAGDDFLRRSCDLSRASDCSRPIP